MLCVTGASGHQHIPHQGFSTGFYVNLRLGGLVAPGWTSVRGCSAAHSEQPVWVLGLPLQSQESPEELGTADGSEREFEKVVPFVSMMID